jgi:hypothetical protein
MAKECAFCPETAKLSAEHLWSDWMNELFPGKKRFTSKNEKGEIVADWSSDELDWKARVVCERCNNTWMSDIESNAKSAMSNLIRGEPRLISQSCADSIALFAFKTAVIFDHIRRDREPFFTRSVRHTFRESSAIPSSVRIFMAGFVPAGKGHVHTCYHEGPLSATERVKLYVCTYAVGHFVFQVVGQKQHGFTKVTLQPRGQRTFQSVAVEFWPWIPGDIAWPPACLLQTVGDFDSFSARWRNLTATSHATTS